MKKRFLSHDELALLCRELALLYHAGVGPASGLLLLAEDCADKLLKAALESIAKELDEGAALSRALENAGLFPDYMCSLINIGEKTGRTEDSLHALAGYYRYQAQLRRRLRAALSYPLLLMAVMLVVIVVLLTRVLPVFDGVYAGLGGSMTGIAGGLLRFGQILDSCMPLLCLLLGLVLLFIAAFSLIDSFQRILAAKAQALFGSRSLMKKMNISRFAQALTMGVSSGLMMDEALELASSLLKDTPLAVSCRKCAGLMRGGMPLAEALGSCALLPAAQCRLLELGMKSGCTESVLEQIARELEEDSDNSMEAALGRIEPAMVLLCSILVGMILLSVMLPLLDIMAAIG